jgi:pyruvate,orthophosphate dikinase
LAAFNGRNLSGRHSIMAKAKPAKAAKSGKLIYFFGKSKCDGKGDMKSLLGGKGANLAAMT